MESPRFIIRVVAENTVAGFIALMALPPGTATNDLACQVRSVRL